jgi:PD-(D/E)XK nuclease superfamily domain
MPRRDTGTGSVMEQMIIPALRRGGYAFKTQVNIGRRPGGGKHEVDLVASGKDGRAILVSLKWQQTSGTAEQKVPFEVISLIKALKNNEGRFSKAYLVLGGGGWTLRDFYVKGGLRDYLTETRLVDTVTLESFVALANQGEL